MVKKKTLKICPKCGWKSPDGEDDFCGKPKHGKIKLISNCPDCKKPLKYGGHIMCTLCGYKLDTPQKVEAADLDEFINR